MPKVSIIIPCYNYESYIIDCLLSCVNQEYEDCEIIVVDDCSTDKSVEMAKKVRDGRIKILRHRTNKGYSAAKNTGIRESMGEYIITLDADDCMTPAGVKKRVEYLDAHPDCDMVHGIAYKFEGGAGYAKLLRKQDKLSFDRRCKIHAQAVALRRSVHKRHGLYYEKLRSKADKEYWSRLMILGVNIQSIKTKCAFYRIHKASMLAMRNRNKNYDKEVTRIFHERLADISTNGVTQKNTEFL